MLARVEPHDLAQICEDCGTTLRELSHETGIMEEELLAFAAGRLGLRATDRFKILEALHKHAPLDVQLTHPPRQLDEVSRMLMMGVGTHVITVVAYSRIMQEVEQEEREARGEDPKAH